MDSTNKGIHNSPSESAPIKRPWYKNTVTLGQTLHVALTLAAFGLGWMASRQSEQARVMTLQLWDNYYSYLMVDADTRSFSAKTTVDFEERGLQPVGEHLYLRDASVTKSSDGYRLAGEIVNSASIPLDGVEMRLFLAGGVHDIAVGNIAAGNGRKFKIDLVGIAPDEFRTAKLITRCADIAYAKK
ncbi:MAG: hypothetical protein RBT76_00805 [candidate division Zixibacteria bacterium]|nr:hypothetical protein [candidate division Zixibacteria bacterium]